MVWKSSGMLYQACNHIYLFNTSLLTLRQKYNFILLIQQQKKFAQLVISCYNYFICCGILRPKYIYRQKIQSLMRSNVAVVQVQYSVILMISHKTFLVIYLFFSPPTDIWCILKLCWKLIQGGLLNNKNLNP